MCNLINTHMHYIYIIYIYIYIYIERERERGGGRGRGRGRGVFNSENNSYGNVQGRAEEGRHGICGMPGFCKKT